MGIHTTEVSKTAEFNLQSVWHAGLTGVNSGLLILNNKNWETENHLRHCQLVT